MPNTPKKATDVKYVTPPHVSTPKRITLSHLQKLKAKGEKITVLTTYDATFAKLFSDMGIEILLIGDTLGMTMLGHPTTVPVTIADIVYHLRSVCRACPSSFLLADMPFMTYADEQSALKNAAKLMRAGAEMVKLEGGAWLTPIVARLTEQGIPVCAHLGLTPQSVHIFGGYKIQGREPAKAQGILEAALAHEKAGAKLLVLECIPHPLATEISQAVDIPVIGIGAGSGCDGQVLVMQDMLGLTAGKPLTFVKNFLTKEAGNVQGAVREYIRQVKTGEFPSLEHSFT